MKIESNKNWTTCLRLNTGDGSPRVFLLNSHFLGSVPGLYPPFLLPQLTYMLILESRPQHSWSLKSKRQLDFSQPIELAMGCTEYFV